MATISAAIRNSSTSDYIVHVYDLFGGGTNEVSGSPFFLAAGETSSTFSVHASSDEVGTVSYTCESGPSLSNIEVEDGETVEI